MNAYVVVGPESSGNRLLAAILIRAGCYGLASTIQPGDDGLPLHGQSPAVIVRSYPHGNKWPELRNIVPELRRRGYTTRVLIVVRDSYCVEQSQLSNHHRTLEEIRFNVRSAFHLIFGQLADLTTDWRLVSLESLFRPEAVGRLLDAIGLPPVMEGPLVVEGHEYAGVEDPNAKHYHGEPWKS